MWAVRNSPVSALLLRRAAATTKHQSLSSSVLLPTWSQGLRCFSSSDATTDGEFRTGKVKFYLRDKAYGFIIPDDNPSTELWVHRTSLDTPHSPDEFPTRPYLLRDEHVKFRVDRVHGQTDKAVQVRFANGREIPLYRKNYHASVVRGEMQKFGQAVFDILKDGKLTDDEKMEQIKAAQGTSEELIAIAAERQMHYGPEPGNK